MTTAAIYARFSSSRQREESIEDQVRVCRARIASEGWGMGPVYTDEARSGTGASGRPGFLRMVDEAQRGAFDVLVVYKLDRFSRNRYDSAVYRAKLRKAGVEVVSATEGVPDGPEGIILNSVLEGMAEYYSANLAQNVMRGMEGNALKCKHNGVRVFGYEDGADGLYHVDEREAPGVRAAFRMAASGARKVDIAAALNSSGYRTVRGRMWSVESVSQMLRQEKYLGVYSWGSVRVEGGMPSIVTRDEWDAAHGNVASAGRKKRMDGHADYMLTGKLFDADGNRFESNSARGGNGTTYYYYRCKATGASIRKDEVEARVSAALSELLESTEGLSERIVSAAMEEWEEENESALKALDASRSRLSSVESEIGNLIDLAARLGASDRIAERIKALEAEGDGLKESIGEMEAGIPRIEPDMVRYMLWRISRCDGPDALVAGFVQRVVVDDDGGCVVTFNLNRPENEKTQTPEGVWESRLGRPVLNSPKLSLWLVPGGFAVAA